MNKSLTLPPAVAGITRASVQLPRQGVDIKLTEYIMRIDVRFENESDRIDWTSHIFLADYIKGDIEPYDKREIKEARLVYPDEIPGFAVKMRETKIGGLNYRAFLTDEMSKRLINNSFKT